MARTRNKYKRNLFLNIKLHQLDWLEYFSIGLCIWLWLFPYPYKFIFSVVLSLPIVGLLLNGLSRPNLASLVSFSNSGKGKYDLADFIEFPGWVILLRVLLDFQFESFYSLIKVGTIGFILLLLILAATHKRVDKANPNRGTIYLVVIINIFIYSYAATYGINCVYDDSEPKVYPAEIIGKSIHRSKHTSYHLKVEAWGTHHDPEDITVSRSQYEKTEIGQTVNIDYKEGLLNIPWYYIE